MNTPLIFLAGLGVLLFVFLMWFGIKSFIDLRIEENSYVPNATVVKFSDAYIVNEIFEYHKEKIFQKYYKESKPSHKRTKVFKEEYTEYNPLACC